MRSLPGPIYNIVLLLCRDMQNIFAGVMARLETYLAAELNRYSQDALAGYVNQLNQAVQPFPDPLPFHESQRTHAQAPSPMVSEAQQQESAAVQPCSDPLPFHTSQADYYQGPSPTSSEAQQHQIAAVQPPSVPSPPLGSPPPQLPSNTSPPFASAAVQPDAAKRNSNSEQGPGFCLPRLVLDATTMQPGLPEHTRKASESSCLPIAEQLPCPPGPSQDGCSSNKFAVGATPMAASCDVPTVHPCDDQGCIVGSLAAESRPTASHSVHQVAADPDMQGLPEQRKAAPMAAAQNPSSLNDGSGHAASQRWQSPHLVRLGLQVMPHDAVSMAIRSSVAPSRQQPSAKAMGGQCHSQASAFSHLLQPLEGALSTPAACARSETALLEVPKLREEQYCTNPDSMPFQVPTSAPLQPAEGSCFSTAAGHTIRPALGHLEVLDKAALAAAAQQATDSNHDMVGAVNSEPMKDHGLVAREPARELAEAAGAAVALEASERASAGPFPWPLYLIGTRDCFTHHLVPISEQVSLPCCSRPCKVQNY